MATISIDGKRYEVEDGSNVLEAVLGLGLDLPYFCWHPAMGSVGSCRQCALLQFQNADDDRGRIVMGCMTQVTDGMLLSLSDTRAKAFRADVIEALMTNHPHDCPVCAEGGECHLQDMTVMSGHRDRRYNGLKNTHVNQDLGPLIHHEMNRCIACYRCVRYYQDYAGGTDLAALGSHDHVYFGRHEDGTLESEFAGNLVEVCPTGVFTDKSLVHDYTRKWDLQSAPSVCSGCGVGCNTIPGERYGRLKRIHNRYHHEVNGYFLCDRGRFGGAWVNSEQRLSCAGAQLTDGRFAPMTHEQAVQRLQELCSADAKLWGIGSPRATLESNWMLQALVGDAHYCPGWGPEGDALQAVVTALTDGGVATATLPEIEAADLVIVVGEDITQSAPRIALALRQSVRNLGLEKAANVGVQHWQDAAVRNIAQNIRSPLIEWVSASTRLADVASETLTLAPPDIARMGFALLAALGDGPVVDGLTGEQASHVARLAELVVSAKRPLIVSGCGSHDASVVNAARALAAAIAKRHAATRVVYAVPECNSVGVGLLKGAHRDFAAVAAAAEAGEIDTLLVLENDLFRRAKGDWVARLAAAVPNIIVLDALEHATCDVAQLVLPVTSFTEAEGTLVSAEGRAQRFYPVVSDSGERLPGWHWLRLAAVARANRSDLEALQHVDDVLAAIAADQPLLAGVEGAAPAASYRDRVGLKAARQPHRYSGRTAMYADKTLHEPKTRVDDDAPLSFSMEGESHNLPSALRSFVWDPGWNSNQSLHKFQAEVGGALKGGSAGIRLIEPKSDSDRVSYSVPAAFDPSTDGWRLTAQYRIFGSDEMSYHAPSIAAVSGGPTLVLSADDAIQLTLSSEDGVTLTTAEGSIDCEVEIDPALPKGTVGFVVGHKDLLNLRAGEIASLEKKPGLMRRPDVIARDGVRAHG